MKRDFVRRTVNSRGLILWEFSHSKIFQILDIRLLTHRIRRLRHNPSQILRHLYSGREKCPAKHRICFVFLPKSIVVLAYSLDEMFHDQKVYLKISAAPNHWQGSSPMNPPQPSTKFGYHYLIGFIRIISRITSKILKSR